MLPTSVETRGARRENVFKCKVGKGQRAWLVSRRDGPALIGPAWMNFALGRQGAESFFKPLQAQGQRGPVQVNREKMSGRPGVLADQPGWLSWHVVQLAHADK